MTSFYLALATITGLLLPVQLGVNNSLRGAIGSAAVAALISFVVGSLCLLAYALMMRNPWPTLQEASRLPAWLWLGGVLGAFYVTSTIFVAQSLGAATVNSITGAAQLWMSLLLDHYGLMGFTQHSINLRRLLGAVLGVAGTVLIVRN